jgi:hypothetical protein
MSIISTVVERVAGGSTGREFLGLVLRGLPDEGSASPDEFSALTDVPVVSWFYHHGRDDLAKNKLSSWVIC